MINDDDPNPQNLDVRTPSPLSSLSDQSARCGEAAAKTESSSAESSLSDFKRRIQELPSPSEIAPLGCCSIPVSRRTTPRNRDGYLFFQNGDNCIEEKDEPDEKELSEERPLNRSDARARRRAKLHSQLSTTSSKAPSEANSAISSELTDLKSSLSLDFSKSIDQDSARPSLSSAKSYPDKSLDHAPDGTRSTYRFSSADNRQFDQQKDTSVLRAGSSLPLMCLPSERVEVRPLPPLALSKTPPTKFGGYRPLRSVVLRNLSSGSDTESNHSSRVSTPCRYDRSNRVAGFHSFDKGPSASPTLSNDRSSREHLVLSPLSSSRLPVAPKPSEQRGLMTRKERIESVISSIISSRTVRNRDDNHTLSSIATTKKTKAPKRDSCPSAITSGSSEGLPTFPENRKLFTRSIGELPVLSARSNICEYERTVAPMFHESNLRQLTKPLATDRQLTKTLATEIILPPRSSTSKKEIQETWSERKSDILLQSRSARSENLCTITMTSDDQLRRESRETVVNEIVSDTRQNTEGSKTSLTERTEKERIRGVRSVHSEVSVRADENTAICRSPEKPSKDEDADKITIWQAGDYTNETETQPKDIDFEEETLNNTETEIPPLPLTSQDQSNSTTPTNRTYTHSTALDTNALIKALSNVSLGKDAEIMGKDSKIFRDGSRDNDETVQMPISHESGAVNECFDTHSDVQVEKSVSRKSLKPAGKSRSRIPVRTSSVKSVKSIKSVRSTPSPASSKYTNDGKPFYSSVNVYDSGSVSIDSNDQTMPNATPLSGSLSLSHACIAADNFGSGEIVCEPPPAVSLPCFPNTREQSKQSTARHTENTSQCYSESESSLERTYPVQTNPQSQLLEAETASENSRYQFKLETPNLSFRSKTEEYSKCSDDTHSEEKYQRSQKSEDYESCDVYDDDTLRSELPDSRGPFLSQENLLRFNDEECMRLNLSAVREMSSIEELSEKTGLCDEANSKVESSDSVPVPTHDASSSHYKSTQVPSWHSQLHERFRCIENDGSSSEEPSEEASEEPSEDSLKVEDDIADTPRSTSKSARSLVSEDQAPCVRKKLKLDEDATDSLSPHQSKSNEETDGLDKLQFSIERLAANKFRKSISLEHAQVTGVDNATYRRYDSRPFVLQCSASTSKLGNQNRIKMLRSQRRSQDRFPFTITEKTSAASTKMKAVPESRHLPLSNRDEKSNSLEKVYKLALHPSITRLAGGGVQDSVSEIMQCIGYSHEDEKSNRRLDMRGLVRKFSAKFKRAKKTDSSGSAQPAETNVLYHNQTYQGDSELNSCSESSLLRELKPCENATDGHVSSPDEMSSAVCETIVSSVREEKNISLPSQTPRSHNRDGQWVETFGDSARNHRTPNSLQTTDTSAGNTDQTAKDIFPAFFVKEVPRTPSVCTPCSPLGARTIETVKEEPFTESVFSSVQQPTPKRSGTSSRELKEEENREKLDNNSDSETDCLCLKLCHSVPRMCKRSKKKYPSLIKRWRFA